MAIRKCLKCGKTVPEVDGPCPHCGHFNASIANRLVSSTLALSVVGILGVAAVLMLVLIWAISDRTVNGVIGLFEYKADVTYEVTGDAESATVSYNTETQDIVRLEDVLLPARFNIKNVTDSMPLSLMASPKYGEGEVTVRILDRTQHKVLAEATNYDGKAIWVDASVSEPE
jgi:hypothetical protein